MVSLEAVLPRKYATYRYLECHRFKLLLHNIVLIYRYEGIVFQFLD